MLEQSRAGDQIEQDDPELKWWQETPRYRQLLLEEMKQLRSNAGWPSRAELSNETESSGEPVRPQTISNMFGNGSNMSGWNAYRKIVEILGGDLRYFYPLYLRASGLVGAREQLLRFEQIQKYGLPTLADPDAEPFVMPGDNVTLATNLTFVDQPPALGEKLRLPHELWAMQLREHPGQWAWSPALTSAQQVHSIIKGTVRHYRPAGSFEAVWRLGHVYVRYIGEDQQYG